MTVEKPFAAVWIRLGKVVGDVHQFATEDARNVFVAGMKAQRDANRTVGFNNFAPDTAAPNSGGFYLLPEQIPLVKQADQHYPTAAGTPSRMDQIKRALGL